MGTLISEKYAAWEKKCDERFNKLKANEEELNRIFIGIYGLQKEMTPEVEEKDVTVRRADLTREIKSLISYAVGCIFGRYSLDTEGLVYAGGAWDDTRYKTIIPVEENLIQIGGGASGEDLASRIADFVRIVYGEDTLEENLRFIADALGGKGDSREVIENYLLTGFFADHCRIYQKRPIYWLFSSGKKHGFKALSYMHRWDRSVVTDLLTSRVRETQERFRAQLSQLEEQMAEGSQSERVKLKKREEKLNSQLSELEEYEEKVRRISETVTDIDPDDGVRVNYAKFQDILEKIR